MSPNDQAQRPPPETPGRLQQSRPNYLNRPTAQRGGGSLHLLLGVANEKLKGVSATEIMVVSRSSDSRIANTPNQTHMKTTTRISRINPNLLPVTFDVGKDSLFAYTELPLADNAANCIEETVANRNAPVLKALDQFKAMAIQHGFEGLCILCEPTGGFENRLLCLARQAGHFTAYLNAESVHKLRIVQSNDASKTDLKDPQTMFTLAKLGKTLTHRQISGSWLVLRELNAHYDALELQSTSLRCRIQALLTQLFCEFSFKKDFLFDSAAVPHLLAGFGLNPYRIVAAGQALFYRRMKKHGVRLRTLERLWKDAEASSLQQLESGYTDLLEDQLRQLFEDFQRCRERLEAAAEKMISVLRELQSTGELQLTARKELINEFLLARIVAETGPLKDFESWQQLLRYAGLNLCERQSGTMTGRRRISKKGRGLLRKVLAHAVLPRVRRTDLYGAYYHAKKDKGMPGQKAMMAVARKFLKLLWGLNRAGSFDRARIFSCQSQFAVQAMKQAA
jgi:transposase